MKPGIAWLIRSLGALVVVLVLYVTGLATPGAAGSQCRGPGLWLQVLGSGGPELEDLRAGSSYLIWQDGHARVMVDAGPGSALRFGQSGADFSDLELLAITHLHVDHSGDLPALVKSGYFSDRRGDLPLLGPAGNALMPGVREFVDRLFGHQGAYRYLAELVTSGSPAVWHLVPEEVPLSPRQARPAFVNSRLRASAVPVHHGPVAALAWRVDIAGSSVVIGGDSNGDWGTLALLAKDADLLVVGNPVPVGAAGVARKLHMPPEVIGKVAAMASVRELLLSHRMRRTLGREAETLAAVRRAYHGPVAFADDLDCLVLPR